MNDAIKSLRAVYNRQHVAHATARTKLVEVLTCKQYQACRVKGFFMVERVPKVTRSSALRQLALEVAYLEAQLTETGRELDEALKTLEDWTIISA